MATPNSSRPLPGTPFFVDPLAAGALGAAAVGVVSDMCFLLVLTAARTLASRSPPAEAARVGQPARTLASRGAVRDISTGEATVGRRSVSGRSRAFFFAG